jgi:hypothetical protein
MNFEYSHSKRGSASLNQLFYSPQTDFQSIFTSFIPQFLCLSGLTIPESWELYDLFMGTLGLDVDFSSFLACFAMHWRKDNPRYFKQFHNQDFIDLISYVLADDINEEVQRVIDQLTLEEGAVLFSKEDMTKLDLNTRFFSASLYLSAHMPFKYAIEDNESKDISIIFRMCMRSVERSLTSNRTSGSYLIRHHKLMIDLIEACKTLSHKWDLDPSFPAILSQVTDRYISTAIKYSLDSRPARSANQLISTHVRHLVLSSSPDLSVSPTKKKLCHTHTILTIPV